MNANLLPVGSNVQRFGHFSTTYRIAAHVEIITMMGNKVQGYRLVAGEKQIEAPASVCIPA